MKNSFYYIYIIRCENNALYTGITTDLERRFDEHKHSLKGAKFTRANKPQKLEIAWKTNSRSSASKLEYSIKQLSKSQKENLISGKETISSIWDNKFDEIQIFS